MYVNEYVFAFVIQFSLVFLVRIRVLSGHSRLDWVSELYYFTHSHSTSNRTFSGRMLPLLSADSLPDYILGASIETAALEGLLKSHASDIDAELSSRSVSAEEYAEKLYKQFNQQGVKVDSLEVPDSYVDSRENTKNITTWMGATSLQEAKGKIAPVSKVIELVERLRLTSWILSQSTTSRLQQVSMPGPSSSSPGLFASSIGSLPFGSKRMRTGPMFGGMPPPAVLTAPSMPTAHATPAVPLPASSVTSTGIQQEQVHTGTRLWFEYVIFTD